MTNLKATPPDIGTAVRIIMIIVVLIISTVQFVRLLSYDFREGPLVGDQSSHLLQALSISEQGNLSFDNGDVEAWSEVDWTPTPRHLFFQKYEHGFAFAKPYGYSAWLAPFMVVFGAVRGVAVGNTALVAALAVFVYLLARRKLDRTISIFAAALFVFGSTAYMYGFVVHPDLFLAVLTAAITYFAVRLDTDKSIRWAVATGTFVGFAFSEKPTLMAIYALLLAAVLWRAREPRLVATVIAAFVVTFLVAIIPYAKYSEPSTWNAYSGQRMQSIAGDVPFDATPETSDALVSLSGTFFGLSFWLETIGDETGEVAQTTGYMFVGRHTGMLPFMPFAFILVCIAAFRRWQRWHLVEAGALCGIAGYLIFYATFFPINYFGGAQSLGNRYLLQVIPAVVVVIVYTTLSRKAVFAVLGSGALLSVLFLGQHHQDPQSAYWMPDRVSLAQQYLPFEHGRTGEHGFACPARINRDGDLSVRFIVEHGSDLCLELLGIEVERVIVDSSGG